MWQTQSDAVGTPKEEIQPFNDENKLQPIKEDVYSSRESIDMIYHKQRFVENRSLTVDDFEYDRKGSDPGLVVIFNQKHFEDVKEFRSGTNRDVNELIQSLGRLGFNIYPEHIHTDFKRQEILTELDNLAQQDLSDYNCLIVVFLTHGGENSILFAKEGWLYTHDVWEYFTTAKCPTLKDKPKFFIFQACKGENRSAVDSTKIECSKIIPETTFTTPLEADMLIAYSAVEGNVSFRHKQNGSWFIQELCRNFTAYGRRDDVTSILIRTTKCVANNYYHSETQDNVDIQKQMPLFVSTLRKRFYLMKSKERSFVLNVLESHKEMAKNINELRSKVDVLYADYLERKKPI